MLPTVRSEDIELSNNFGVFVYHKTENIAIVKVREPRPTTPMQGVLHSTRKDVIFEILQRYYKAQ